MGKFSFSRKATSSSAYGKMSLSRSSIREEEGRGRKVKNEKLGERERAVREKPPIERADLSIFELAAA